MSIFDKESYLAGLQLGRRLKTLDAKRNVQPSPEEVFLLTEMGMDILTEDDEEILLE